MRLEKAQPAAAHLRAVRRLGKDLARLTEWDAIAATANAHVAHALDVSWVGLYAPDNRGALAHGWGACPEDVATAVAAGALVTELTAGGAQQGWLVCATQADRPLTAHGHAFLAAAGSLIASTLDAAHLRRQQRGSSAQLVEEDRRRIALDIHDDPLQRAILLARELRSSAGQNKPLPVSRWREAVDDLIASLRAVCADLRPEALDRWGLAAGLEQLVRDVAVRSDLEATFNCNPYNAPRPLPCGLETALYRVAQEALNNCMKHARASKVEVTLGLRSDTVSLVIVDDGQGAGAGAGQEGLRLGLRGMRERLAPWGGWVQVRSGFQGGTVVEARTMVDESRRAS